MYKVFVNEKKLLISKFPEALEKKLKYENLATFEIAIDLLQNTSTTEINIYHNELDVLWSSFSGMLKNIEAAGGIVLNKNNEILFIKRLGRWDLPKGKIELGESTEDAALREVEEETGLKNLHLEKFISKTYHIYVERNGVNVLKTTHWYKMHYNGTENATPQLEEGITEVSWKGPNEIQKEVLPSTFKNIKLILEHILEN